jgi:hypothetical protein
LIDGKAFPIGHRCAQVLRPTSRYSARLNAFVSMRKPQTMRARRETAEHPFGTLEMGMGATHFLMKTLPEVASEMGDLALCEGDGSLRILERCLILAKCRGRLLLHLDGSRLARIDAPERGVITHMCDSAPAESGAPILLLRDGGAVLVGIHLHPKSTTRTIPTNPVQSLSKASPPDGLSKIRDVKKEAQAPQQVTPP